MCWLSVAVCGCLALAILTFWVGKSFVSGCHVYRQKFNRIPNIYPLPFRSTVHFRLLIPTPSQPGCDYQLGSAGIRCPQGMPLSLAWEPLVSVLTHHQWLKILQQVHLKMYPSGTVFTIVMSLAIATNRLFLKQVTIRSIQGNVWMTMPNDWMSIRNCSRWSNTSQVFSVVKFYNHKFSFVIAQRLHILALVN